MTGKAFDQLWHLISGALTLNPEVYNQINSLPQGIQVRIRQEINFLAQSRSHLKMTKDS
ncbi:MAG: hypothetical protein F6K54_19255 [Okeania sp. SIO3B5]|uniref:hypothetical protein n=1 Tax=Okeania sp. SIO3B5 TaxID=2607811 RepID=UPI001401A2BD|nr:hypothetical protein [Okeania sp. SIO3B5]NEO55024.1 hypothetical protein [Okeania sp. SIO3B5]